jgi:hypothetical protein
MTPSSLLKQHAGSGREPRRKKAPSAACVNEIGIGEARSGPQDGTLVEARSRGGNPWNLPTIGMNTPKTHSPPQASVEKALPSRKTSSPAPLSQAL